MLLQALQFGDGVCGSFSSLARGFFRHGPGFGQRLRDGRFAIFHLRGEERRGRLSASRNFFSDRDLVFQPFLDVDEIGLRAIQCAAALDAFLFGALQSSAQRFAGGAELLKRFGDAVGGFRRCGLRVFNASGKAEHGAVDRRDSAVEPSHSELRAAFDRLNALGETRRIVGALRADPPIVIGVVVCRSAHAIAARPRRGVRGRLGRFAATATIATAMLTRQRVA